MGAFNVAVWRKQSRLAFYGSVLLIRSVTLWNQPGATLIAVNVVSKRGVAVAAGGDHFHVTAGDNPGVVDLRNLLEQPNDFSEGLQEEPIQK
tara:strand:+ start:249 stop:524 length:276 start_codon:yes stop_codon:yes gene_type:complete